jgi:hypothetical protein
VVLLSSWEFAFMELKRVRRRMGGRGCLASFDVSLPAVDSSWALKVTGVSGNRCR